MYKTLPDAIALAEFAHRGQVDKAAHPYIDHPKRVLATVQARGVAPYVQIAAVLHDVVEDTPFSDDILLRLGITPAAVHLVDLLTRREGVLPDEYYAKIAANPDAVIIKEADIHDNLAPWRLSYLPEHDQVRLRGKYARALAAIHGEAK